MAERVRVSDSVFLRNGFAAEGEVRFLGAEIGGNLLCAGGTFENPGADALDIDGAKAAGILELRGLSEKPAGRVILRSAHVGELSDDRESWPNAGELVLDGFTYDHLAGTAPHSAEERLAWIGLQAPDNFSIQPYEHLAIVLRRMGLEHEARRVAIAKQRALRARLPGWRKPWSYFLDVSIGYGYRPWRAVVWLLALWGIGALYLQGFDAAAAMCATKASPYCAAVPSGYPEFQPSMYVIDSLLPFLDLHQEVYWEPNPATEAGATLRLLQWVSIALGWLFSILAAVGFSGVLRKD